MSNIQKVLENLKISVDEAQLRSDELIQTLNERKNLNEELCNEIESLKRKINLKDYELSKRESQFSDLNKKYSSAELELETNEQRNSHIQNEENQFDVLNDEFNQIHENVRLKESRLNELQMRKNKLESDIASLSSQVNKLKEKYDSLIKELNNLRNQPETSGHHGDMDEDTMYNRRKELEELIRDLDVSNEDLQRQIKLKEIRKSTLDKTLKSILNKIDKHMEERKSLEAELLA